MLTGNEIAAAFMQQNEKRTWKARCVSRQGKGDTVYFESQGGMVALVYTPDDGRFAVKFTKFQGAWGDYIKAIARSLFTVLNTLKSAGLPFDAPPTLAGMAIEATTTDDNLTYVRWPGTSWRDSMAERLDAMAGVDEGGVVPPVAELVENQTLALGSELEEHLEGAGFEQVQPDDLPEGVSMFVGKLPPVL